MQLADYPLVLSIISGTNNDIRIDPDAEVCFFYGCFKDTLNFDNACYVNSTNMAICRKGKLIILIAMSVKLFLSLTKEVQAVQKPSARYRHYHQRAHHLQVSILAVLLIFISVLSS